jgi:hypothetical protein
MTDQRLSDLIGAAMVLAPSAGGHQRGQLAQDLLIDARVALAGRPDVTDRFSWSGYTALPDEDRRQYQARELRDAELVAVDMQARHREDRADARDVEVR